MTTEINLFRSLTYYDPAIVLTRLHALAQDLANVEMDDRVRRLRTSALRPDREARDAALFTYGMSQRTGLPMGFARHESSDYDFVVASITDGTTNYCPVQLKELVPEDLNPKASVTDLLARLESRARSSQTILAVRLNRRGHFDLAVLAIPRLPYREVWFFWAASEDQATWALYGDALSMPDQFNFTYPGLDVGAA